MIEIIQLILMAVVPLAVVAFFVVSLVLFIKTPKGTEKRKSRKIMLIVSSVILGLFVATIIAIMIMMMLVVRFM